MYPGRLSAAPLFVVASIITPGVAMLWGTLRIKPGSFVHLSGQRGSGALLLQCRWNECVRQDVQGFVQVRARMFGSHTGTETDFMLRHSRIINRGDPSTASSQ